MSQTLENNVILTPYSRDTYMLSNSELYNRELVDKVFYQALLDFGTSNFTAKIFYNFVKYKHILRSKLK